MGLLLGWVVGCKTIFIKIPFGVAVSSTIGPDIYREPKRHTSHWSIALFDAFYGEHCHKCDFIGLAK